MKANDTKAIRRLKFAVWLLLGITLLGGALGGALFTHIYGLSGWRPHEAATDETPVYTQAQVDKFITSVLITVQNEPMGSANAPADMVFIASFNALEQKLNIVPLISSLNIPAEGYGEKTLSEIYALGGAGLLINAVNQSFGLDLQSYACTDTHSLAAMIDLLGGIEARLSRDEANYINDALGTNNVSSGRALLTGTQCMVHALDNRSDAETFGSAARQEALISAAVAHMRKTATKDSMIPLLTLVFSNIRTNLDTMALRGFGYEILKAEDMEYASLIVPCEGSWEYTAEGDAPGVLTADIAQNSEAMRKLLYNIE